MEAVATELIEAKHKRDLVERKLTSVKVLVDAIKAYLAEHYRDPKPFVWTKCRHDLGQHQPL